MAQRVNALIQLPWDTTGFSRSEDFTYFVAGTISFRERPSE